MVFALQTARKGSEGVPGKNMLEVGGRPMYLHNVLYAKRSQFVKDVFVSTDDPAIVDAAPGHGYQIIIRPPELAGSDVGHYDVILHGLRQIEQTTGEQATLLVVLLGNTISAYPEDLDAAISGMLKEPTWDSCVSVSEFNMFNPYRAYREEGGFLHTIVPQEYIAANLFHKDPNDRRAAGDIYFLNGSFWVIRRESVVRNDGYLPFPWLGRKMRPFLQPVVLELDALWQLPSIAAQPMK